MSFDWDTYLSQSGSVMVPEEMFEHYTASIKSRLGIDRLCEVMVNNDSYWLGVVRLVCGPLIQVSYITPDTPSELQPSHTFWLDTKIKGVYRYGHCKQDSLVLAPPAQISSDLSVQCWYEWAASKYLLYTWQPLETSFPAGGGLCPVDSIRPGLKFELRSELEPDQFWGVTVTENNGGVLGLSFDSPELKLSTDLYCYYLDNRLYPCGTVLKNPVFSFSVPVKLRERGGGLGYPEQVWKVVQQSFAEIREELQAPAWCFENNKLEPVQHGFEERMLLTVIDPVKQDRFRVAMVDKVVSEVNFLISLLEEPDKQLLCQGGSENIVPISWAIENKFLEKASLQNMSCSPLSKIAGKSLFLAMNEESCNFVVGQKLEFCQSFDEKRFCIGSIFEITGHILTLEIFPPSGRSKILTSIRSLHLFPAGWCNEYGLVLFSGEQTSPTKLCQDEEIMNDSSAFTEILEPVANEIIKDDKSISFVRPLPLPLIKDSSWCPPIYFNHLCYSASFLSKHRLESLPRYIGAGPVRLVMREVLSRLIGSSFKSGAVLKKLEVGEDRARRPDFWLENMKGKSRVLLLQADVEIPSKTSQVTAFCREVCQKLSCCPYLFGPQLVGEECPSACNSRPKSHFQLEGEQAGRNSRRGRKGRKRPKVIGEREESAVGDNNTAAGDSSDSASSSPSCSTTVTSNTTRDNSPELSEGGKRKYGPKNWGELLPPSEIRTRGAKLPTFSQQLKVRPSKKDVEELERLIAEKCVESPPPSPPRPLSPKLLRSKTAQAALLTIEASKVEPLPEVNAELKPAFTMDQVSQAPPYREPPPIRHITLPSNPLLWTSTDLADFLTGQSDVSHMAHLFKEEEVDGQAFLLMNLPTVMEHWRLRLGEGIVIARHVESVKLAFYKQFVYGGQGRRERGVWG